jgi:hypothetical protein
VSDGRFREAAASTCGDLPELSTSQLETDM